jgi:hypothetical protein
VQLFHFLTLALFFLLPLARRKESATLQYTLAFPPATPGATPTTTGDQTEERIPPTQIGQGKTDAKLVKKGIIAN